MVRKFTTIALIAVLASGAGCFPVGNDQAAAGETVAGAATVETAEPAAPQAASQPAARPEPKPPLTQVGPWYAATFNVEEPYINILHASQLYWSGNGMQTPELIAAGVIDKSTGLPVRLPEGKWLTTGVYFTGLSDISRALHWDGEWVLEWEGDADLWIEFLPSEMQWRSGKNRIEFTRDFKRGKTPYHSAIQIRKMRGPLTALRLFRKENEAALKAGKIYNPVFAAAVSRYDILRTMDLQGTNSSVIRSLADVPGMNAVHWANTAWKAAPGFIPPFQSMPLEAVFRAGVETDTAVWFHVPITIGAPRPFHELKPDDDDNIQWAGAYRGMARENAASIIESQEWDHYADAVVAALIDSGYPQDRPLYVTLANEVWNFSGQYFMTTQYAWGIGEGLALNQHEPLRVGYGALSARWKLAFDAALEKAGRTQPVVYVIEGQAFFPKRTLFALSGAKDWLASKGEDWSKHAPGFGVSVATYWAATWEAFLAPEQWPAAISDDPDGTAKRFADFILTHPAQFGLRSVLTKLAENQREAAAFGVPLIGAYEGGSHLEKPKYVDQDWYTDFHWGVEGGRVNRVANQAIADAFPGFILSNYGLVGAVGGQPWFEGLYGSDNPHMRSWEPFLRPARGDEADARDE